MYQIFKSWISFVSVASGNTTGLSLSNQESALLYGCIMISCLLIIFFADLLYRLIRSFIRR